MTQYRTNNPLGSMAPRDLYDNAQNVDNWSNGEEPFYEDRFGVMRRSFSGMNFEFEAAQTGRQAAFDTQMTALGYASKGAYAAGVVLERYNEYVAVPGIVSGGSPAFYRPGPNAELPLTLEGDWGIDGPLLVQMDRDDVLRNDLAGNPKDGEGAALVNGAFLYFDSTVTVRVPTDYATLQEAFNAHQNARTPSGQQINLLIESGHAPASGLTVSNGDFGHFTISAQDPLVTVSPQFSGYFLSVRNAVAPTMSCKVDQALLGDSGLRYDMNSTGLIDPGCGVIRAGGNGLIVFNGSRIVCLSSVFDGAAGTGMSIQGSSTLMGNNSSIKDCVGSGVVIGSSCNVTIRMCDVSGCVKGTPGLVSGAIIADRSSVLDARGSNCQNSGWKGIWIDNGSVANLRDVNVSGAVDDGIFTTRGSSVHCEDAVANNIGKTALDVQLGCTVNASGFASNVAGEYGLYVSGGSNVNVELGKFTAGSIYMKDSTVNLSQGQVSSPVGNGVSVYNSTLYAASLKVTGATGIGLITQASWVGAQFAQIQNSGGKGVTATQGSHVVLRGGTISGNVTRDLEVTQGSQIFATTASTTAGTGSPALANTNVTAFNSISGNLGIVWD